MTDDQDRGRVVAIAALVVVAIAGCGLYGGQAHADVVLDIANRTGSTVTLRWTGAKNRGTTFVGPCRSTRQGLNVDQYTLEVEGTAGSPVALDVPFAQEPPTRWVVISAGGAIDVNGAPRAAGAAIC